MEIKHLIDQRDKFHGRPQPVKPTVGITHDTGYFRDVPESGALIRSKDDQKKMDKDNLDDDSESSSINAAEAEVAARLRVVTSTAGTRYTTRLGTRLLQGRYVELYDQEGHVDRVLEAARDEQAKKYKKKQSKKAAADDEAHLKALVEAETETETETETKPDLNAAGTGNGKTTIGAALRTIRDPRGRQRSVDFEPLGAPEIDFLTTELVKGEYDEAAVNVNVNVNVNGGLESNERVLKEATRQTVLNSTYLPKDVRTFRLTLERVMGAGGAGTAAGASK